MESLNKTDFDILEVLADGKRNVATNIAIEIEADRGYVNTRLSYLLEEDLVVRVGPKKQSGLYEITNKGKLVEKNKEKVLEKEIDNFERYIDQKL
jgi:predicted transcriptional regulator